MTTRLAVMKQIKSDLEDNLHSGLGYNHTPVEIKRGMYKWDDFIQKPALCYTLFADLADTDNAYGEDARWLNFYFYIYAQTDGDGNTDQIHEMTDDIENFVQSEHFTFASQTMIGDIEIMEGGVSQPINTSIIQVRILYES